MLLKICLTYSKPDFGFVYFSFMLLLFFITPKAAHNSHEKQHNPKHKGENIHKHTKIIKPNEQKKVQTTSLMTPFDMTVETP